MAIISFDSASDFSLYEGKGSDLFPFQGLTSFRVKAISEGKAKDSGNLTLNFELVCTEKGYEGLKIFKTQPVSGMRKDNKPNIIGLYEILTSIYSGTESSIEAAVAKVRALDGTNFDTEELIPQLVDQTMWGEVQTRKFTKKDTGEDGFSSELRNPVPKQRFLDAVAMGNNAHHRPNPPEAGGKQATTNGSAGASQSVSQTVKQIM